MKTHIRKIAIGILFFCMLFINAHAVIPDNINYQAYLTDNTSTPINSTINITFSLYNVEIGGIPLWSDTLSVMVDKGLLNVQLGRPSNAFPHGLFDNPLWLGVAVGGDLEMTGRKPISSNAFSYKSDDALTLAGYSAFELDQSAHVLRIDNPHAVTANQVGAISSANFTLHANNPNAHHNKTTRFSELTDTISDTQIPAAISRDSELQTHTNTNDAHHKKTNSFTELTDQASDAQIPDTITVIQAQNANTLDGLDSTAFMPVTTDNWVNVTGDAMTGNLLLPNSKIGVGNFFSPSGNPLQLHVGRSTDPLMNGITFWEFQDFGMSIGYDGVGDSTLNMLRFYTIGKFPIASVNSIGLSVGGDFAAQHTLDIMGDFRLRNTTGNDLITSNNLNMQLGYSSLATPPIKIWGETTFYNDFTTPINEVTIHSHEPRLVLLDRVEDGTRNRISFLNNSAAFDSDDLRDQGFHYYSIFSNNRAHDSFIAIHGKSTSSWGNNLVLKHDGTNGLISTDVGDIALLPAVNVGIGTESPLEKLEVEGGPFSVDGADALSAIRMKQNDVNKWTFMTAAWLGDDDLRIRNESTGADVMTFDRAATRVGIGTTSPSYTLHVNGSVAGTSWTNISSRDYKKDIKRVSHTEQESMLNRLMDFKLSTYKYKTEFGGDDTTKLGFIAEEMPKEVLSKDGKGVDVYELLAYTIGAIKAQQEKIAELEAKLAAQEGL